jgi:hypothetical protein
MILRKFNRLLKHSPIFLLPIAVYPILSLLSANIREVYLLVATRPMILCLLFMGMLFGSLQFFFKDRGKSAIAAGIFFTYLFSYGHIYNALIEQGINKPNRLLGMIGIAIIAATTWFVKRSKKPTALFYGLNIFSIILILFPIFRIGNFMAAKGTIFDASPIPRGYQSTQAPDMYYIILDGYSRADTLSKIDFDNSPFLDELEEIGFYIAECSISNYRNTVNSIASALNMDYLWRSIPNEGEKDENTTLVYDGIKHSSIRQILEARGYKTIGFETGYAWLNLTDAHTFLSPRINYFWSETLLPIEELFIQTTVLKPFVERGIITLNSKTNDDTRGSQFQNHYKIVQYALDTLPSVAEMEGPKFVYLHLVVPHAPYIFLPDGSFNPNSDFYANPDGNGTGLTRELSIEGYRNNLRFINNRIPDVVREIIEKSESPPVIILQGDHGLIYEEYKTNILNAYYLPGSEYSTLYSTISPVNSFRIVLNEYFLDEDLPLVEDISIATDIGRPFRQTVAPTNAANPEKCP